jgi:hypothetical protein
MQTGVIATGEDIHPSSLRISNDPRDAGQHPTEHYDLLARDNDGSPSSPLRLDLSFGPETPGSRFSVEYAYLFPREQLAGAGIARGYFGLPLLDDFVRIQLIEVFGSAFGSGAGKSEFFFSLGGGAQVDMFLPICRGLTGAFDRWERPPHGAAECRSVFLVTGIEAAAPLVHVSNNPYPWLTLVERFGFRTRFGDLFIAGHLGIAPWKEGVTLALGYGVHL